MMPVTQRAVTAVGVRSILVLLGIGGALALAEFWLRSSVIAQSSSRYPAMYVGDARTGFRLAKDFDGDMHADGATYKVFTDSDGWRVANRLPLDPNAVRVAVIGDSFIFGHLMNYEDSIPALLQDSLSAVGEPVVVKNFGTPGFCPLEYASWVAAEAVSWQPDLLIIAVYAGNDFLEIDEHGKSSKSVLGGRLLTINNAQQSLPNAPSRWLLTHSVLWRRLSKGLELDRHAVARGPVDPCAALARNHGVAADTYLIDPPPEMRGAYEQAETLLAQCLCEAEQHGVTKVALWSLPAPVEYDPRQFELAKNLCKLEAADYDLNRPSRFLSEVAARLNVPYFAGIEPLQEHAMQHGADGLYTDVHLSALGNRVVCKPMTAWLAGVVRECRGATPR
jgi:hypothetical protein